MNEMKQCGYLQESRRLAFKTGNIQCYSAPTTTSYNKTLHKMRVKDVSKY